MDDFKRFGIYAIPEGAFLEAGSAWLGWDITAGKEVPQPALSGLPDLAGTLTQTPRKYGFHGTIKPPFRLAEGTTAQGLADALGAFCAGATAVDIPQLEVCRLGGFVAITPAAPSGVLADLAANAVRRLDPFRAPASEAELAKRRKSGLTDRQDALLTRWGYPYVMEEFRFHLTLTGDQGATDAEIARNALSAHFAPVLPSPYHMDSLCLVGEDAEGRFHLIHRYSLTG